MGHEQKKGESDCLRDVIRKEVDAATRTIPEESLRARIEARLIAESTAVGKRRAPAVRKWGLVFIPASVLFVLFAVFMITKPSRLPGKGEGLLNTITRLIQDAPGIQSGTGGIDRPTRNPLSGGILEDFVRAVRENRQTGAADDNLSQRTMRGKTASPLSIEETMRILLRDRSVEKVLSEYSKKNTEV